MALIASLGHLHAPNGSESRRDNMENKRLQVALNEDEWQMLENIRAAMGLRNYSEVIRQLIRREKE